MRSPHGAEMARKQKFVLPPILTIKAAVAESGSCDRTVKNWLKKYPHLVLCDTPHGRLIDAVAFREFIASYVRPPGPGRKRRPTPAAPAAGEVADGTD